MADDEIDWVALDRYVAGEGTAEEREKMRRRIQASPTLTAVVDVMRSARTRSAPVTESGDADAAWRTLAARLNGDVVKSARRQAPLTLMPPATTRASGPARVVGWAAAILLVAGGSYASWREFHPAVSHQAAAPSIRATYSTGRGERATVELRDGTRVTLAPQTEMRVAALGRQVYLTGQAVFSVTHDPTQPFRVIAPGGTTVQDLGTQFDLRAYDKSVRIVVAEGSVSIQGDHPVVLTPGTLAVVDTTGAARVTRGIAVDPYLAWSQGHLTFVNTPMREVIPELERWYDVELHLGSARLADDRLTVTLSDIPADVAINVIARALDATVVRSGQSVTLVPRR